MNLREYTITVILLLAIAAGCYSWLSAVLLKSAETTSRTVSSSHQLNPR